MAEAANKSLASGDTLTEASVAVVVPLFPKLPGIGESLTSLGTQTCRPNLVVLLDDGTSPEAESLHDIIPDLNVEVVQVSPGSLAAALETLSDYLENYKFVGILQAGDAYAPDRIEKCIAALQQSREGRPLALAVTGILAVNGRRQPLPPDDPRAAHLERLWGPGRAGAGLADWLGAGYFAGPASNIFIRRDFLAGNPLPADVPYLAQALVLLTGLQGLLTIVHEPLLLHYPPPFDREPTSRAMADVLKTQTAVLSVLGSKLGAAPETRRNLASYHRAAWNSLSGLREDLFQQVLLRLSSLASPDDIRTVTAEVLRSREAETVPAHWAGMFDSKAPMDLAGYAAALRRTREKLEEARNENERLQKIADAAQDSGWVRFGAWIGERSSRRMMELEQEEEEATPEPPAAKNGADAAEEPKA